MLLFYCADTVDPATASRDGVRDETGEGLVLRRSLASVEAACSDPLLVVDAAWPNAAALPLSTIACAICRLDAVRDAYVNS